MTTMGCRECIEEILDEQHLDGGRVCYAESEATCSSTPLPCGAAPVSTSTSDPTPSEPVSTPSVPDVDVEDGADSGVLAAQDSGGDGDGDGDEASSTDVVIGGDSSPDTGDDVADGDVNRSVLGGGEDVGEVKGEGDSTGVVEASDLVSSAANMVPRTGE